MSRKPLTFAESEARIAFDRFLMKLILVAGWVGMLTLVYAMVSA